MNGLSFLLLTKKWGDFLKYQLLHSEYYKDPENFEALYASRVNCPAAIHLPVEISGYPAFFLILPEFFKTIDDSCTLQAKIMGIENTLPPLAINKTYIENLIEEVMLTNDIEGVNSSKKEITEALESIKNKAGKKKFQGMVNKYNKLLSNDHPTLSSAKDIRAIYDELVLDEIDKENIPDGEIFRKGQVEVASSTQKVKHLGVYPESKLIDFMEKSLSIFSMGIGRLIELSIFHYLFGYAHPFYDGNGRTSRFISSSLLEKVLGRSVAMNLSYAIKNTKSNYEKVFDVCNDEKNRGDLTPFVIYFLDVIRQAAQRAYDSLEEANTKFIYYTERLDKRGKFGEESLEYKILYLLLQAALFGDSFVSISEITKYTESSSYLAKKAIERISKFYVINDKIFKRCKYYSMDINLLDEAVG